MGFSRVSIVAALCLSTVAMSGARGADVPAAAQAPPRSLATDQLQDSLAAAGDDASPVPAAGMEIYRGTGHLLGRRARRRDEAATASEPADITLNFVNTDVKDVAKAILGDYLKLNYEIGADVQGTITIQTSQPLTRSQVLPVLEQVLRLNDMALVQTDGVYKVVPLANAPHVSGAVQADGASDASLGYGIEVVPIHYITAAEMQKLLEPLAPAQGIVHVDAARNILIIKGTQEERQTILDDVALFDADWLSGMSFALYTPTYVDADELVRELNQVLGGLGGTGASLVRLVPIDRLGAVLAISPEPRTLEQLRGWVARLDRPGQGTDRRFYVYHVQNGRASDLADAINKTLLGHGAESAMQPAPETAATSDQSGDGGSTGTATASRPEPQPPMQGSGGVGLGDMAGVSVTANEVNNALVVLATPQEYTRIRTAVAELDTQPLQVFLEAAIAEITLGNNLQYGVQYSISDAQNQIVLSNTKTTAIAPSAPGLSYIFTKGANIQVILNELSAETHVEVISSPKLFVLNNQTATLQVGNRVPIATEQAVSTVTTGAPVVNSIQYQDTGVILKVTPRVNQGGLVMMDISQEVSDVTPNTTSGIDSPTIEERKINSSVAIQDGETVALGGLIQDTVDKSKSGIPLIQDIPVLGSLFGTTSNNKSRTELIVLITPHVVDNVEKARAITTELRDKLPSLQQIFDRGD